LGMDEHRHEQGNEYSKTSSMSPMTSKAVNAASSLYICQGAPSTTLDQLDLNE